MYNLIKRGVYPKPRVLHNSRPFFDPEQVASIVQINESGVGYDGNYFLFYSRVTKPVSPEVPNVRSDNSPEILDGLKALGLTKATSKDVRSALKELYPNGMDGIEGGVILRAVFRYLRTAVGEKL